MKRKETLIKVIKIGILLINIILNISISYFIIISSTCQSNSDYLPFLSKGDLQKITNFINIIINYIEFHLNRIFGLLMGKFILTCLSSGAFGTILSYFIVKRINSLQIAKLGI